MSAIVEWGFEGDRCEFCRNAPGEYLFTFTPSSDGIPLMYLWCGECPTDEADEIEQDVESFVNVMKKSPTATERNTTKKEVN